MLVSIADVSASCKGCGDTDFRVLSPGKLRLASRLACTRCGAETTYLDLLEAIGEEAMRRANEALTKLKRMGPRRPKPKK